MPSANALFGVAVMLRGLCVAVAVFVAFVASPALTPAWADVVVRVDLSSQSMTVKVNGQTRHSWPVSTGRGRYRTPTGNYRPYLLKRRHYSSKYNNAPMPYSIFYRGGYAIHGTTDTKRLGRPASHGCIRLHPSNAARLFSLVSSYGKGSTRILITR
jgi:lipoprotein-anchoring transpeptidase ErfK/SrfK